jgi:urease beta subunit
MGVTVKGSNGGESKSGGMGWMQKGSAASIQMQKQAEAEAEARKAQQGKMWAFWMTEGEPGVRLTFVDGDLDENGFFAPPRYYEHSVKIGNKIDTYVCPEKTNPDLKQTCPLCEEGNRAYLVALFTVIDHRSYESKKTPGVMYKDTPKLLKAKTQTAEYLASIAQKRGGLAGCTFDVERHGDKSASVGSHYDFIEKRPVEELKKKYVRTYKDEKGKDVTVSVFEPADYEQEIVFLTEEELRGLGFGKGATTGMKPSTSSASAKDYGSQL